MAGAFCGAGAEAGLAADAVAEAEAEAESGTIQNCMPELSAFWRHFPYSEPRHVTLLSPACAMYLPQNRADLLFHWVVHALVALLGALMLAFPAPRVPTNLAAYVAVEGTLASLHDRSGRRHHLIEFQLQGDPRVFQIRRIPFQDAARDWAVGHSRLGFRVLPGASDARGAASSVAVPGTVPTPIFGLSVDGRAVRSPEEDVSEANHMASPFMGLFALGLGVLGLLVSGWRWRRRVDSPPPETGSFMLAAGTLSLLGAAGLGLVYGLVYWPSRGRFNEEGRDFDALAGVVIQDQGGVLAAGALLCAVLGVLLLRWGRVRRRRHSAKQERPPARNMRHLISGAHHGQRRSAKRKDDQEAQEGQQPPQGKQR